MLNHMLYLLQHAYALSILSDQLFDGARALDVGSGSGYLSACMAFMVGSRGHVIGIEHIPELIEVSTRNVREDNPHFFKEDRIKFVGKLRTLLTFVSPLLSSLERSSIRSSNNSSSRQCYAIPSHTSYHPSIKKKSSYNRNRSRSPNITCMHSSNKRYSRPIHVE